MYCDQSITRIQSKYKHLCNTRVKEDKVIERYFLISEAAKRANLTSETLRHYDRIGLVQPRKIDPASRYRYYAEADIIRLQIVDLLKQTGLSLHGIKDMLDLKDFEKIIQSLVEAEVKVDAEIKRLQHVKQLLQFAKRDSEQKMHVTKEKASLGDFYTRNLHERAIILAPALKQPVLKNLWRFHDYFYDQMAESIRDQIIFENTAGILTKGTETCLFAVCKQYAERTHISFLPKGTYLCCYCSEENREQGLKDLIQKAKETGCTEIAFTVQEIVFTGLIHWDYELQILIT